MTLRSKLNTLFGLTLLLGLSLVTLVALEQTRAHRQAEIREGVAKALGVVDASLRRNLEHQYLDPQNVENELFAVIQRSLKGYDHITHAEVEYGFLGSEPSSATVLLEARPDESEGRSVHLTRTLELPRSLVVRVTLFADTSDADHFQRRLLGIFILVAALVLAASLIATSFLTEKVVTAPIGELRHLTRRVARGDLDASPPWGLRNRYDEIGVLASSFATMVQNLRRARDENADLLAQTQDFNRQLESRVQEATLKEELKNQQLQAANGALIEARDQLTRQERLAALGQLAGSIAHEIGTPLSTISGHLQLLLFEDLPPDAREAVEVAHGEAARMTEIIRRFLSSTRGVQPMRQAINLRELLDQTLGLTLPAASRVRYDIEMYIAPEVVQPLTDPALLRQLLINLIGNARDAMPEGGRLILEARRRGSHLTLHVDDSGEGVPDSLKGRIFEPFFTTKGPDQGTGLGLSICREIARALRGTLEVSDAPEGGARFTLNIPAWDEELRR